MKERKWQNIEIQKGITENVSFEFSLKNENTPHLLYYIYIIIYLNKMTAVICIKTSQSFASLV